MSNMSVHSHSLSIKGMGQDFLVRVGVFLHELVMQIAQECDLFATSPLGKL